MPPNVAERERVLAPVGIVAQHVLGLLTVEMDARRERPSPAPASSGDDGDVAGRRCRFRYAFRLLQSDTSAYSSSAKLTSGYSEGRAKITGWRVPCRTSICGQA